MFEHIRDKLSLLSDSFVTHFCHTLLSHSAVTQFCHRVLSRSAVTQKKIREDRARRLLRGREGGGSARCVRYQLDVVELDLSEGV